MEARRGLVRDYGGVPDETACGRLIIQPAPRDATIPSRPLTPDSVAILLSEEVSGAGRGVHPEEPGIETRGGP